MKRFRPQIDVETADTVMKSSGDPERHALGASDFDKESALQNLDNGAKAETAKTSPNQVKEYDQLQDHPIVHTVQCSGKGEGHEGHTEQDYRDPPRLYEGDSKASRLRGQWPISNLTEFVEESNKGANFVVYRYYSCHQYSSDAMLDFHSLRKMPKVEPGVRATVLPYLFCLATDGPLAAPQLEEMAIISDTMRAAMGAVEHIHPDCFPGWHRQELLHAPYLHVFHGRRLLESMLQGDWDPETKECIRQLLDYVLGAFGKLYEEAETLFADGKVSRGHFTKLFGPNEVVITRQAEISMGLISKHIPHASNHPVRLNCWSWGFDGLFRKESKTLSVDWPASTTTVIPMTDLAAYPLRFGPAGLEEELKRRGRSFWDCRKRKFVSYDAPVRSNVLQMAPPRYMIDIETYRRMHSDKELKPRGPDDLSEREMESTEPPEDHPFLMVLPGKVSGFGFHDKKWRTLLVEYIRPVDWNDRAFDSIVLKAQKKELIKALVTVHLKTIQPNDVIDDKGNGLIMLFHGGPGTGKTLTAESVAEVAQKPLYRVTCGDIGTDPESVEKYLDSVLYIGSIWECVVLLDEADVFLEERSPADLQRNALVSVFLRVLEYYQGILILTTNRVGTFDEAFKSRVQLALHYPKLSEEGRWKIWRNMIQAVAENDKEVQRERLKDKIDELARHNLNGRQIRNTVKTARQLAEYRREKLEYSHFETAIEVANEFEDYLLKTQGQTDEENAREQRTRY